jgi:hypothetical protein
MLGARRDVVEAPGPEEGEELRSRIDHGEQLAARGRPQESQPYTAPY